MWNIHLSVAKKFADNFREEAMKGWAEKLAQGWLPSVPPPGYMTITSNGKRIHVPNPETKSIAKRMFQLYLDPSQTTITVTEAMKHEGLRSRAGRPIVQSQTARILANPFYIGINRFKGADYPGVQETFISKATFNRVQQKLRGNRPLIRKKHNPVFKNILYCDGCQRLIIWQIQKGRFYGCCKRKEEQCKGRKFLREDKVEDSITKALHDLVCPSPAVIDWLVADVRSRYSEAIEERNRSLAAIKSQLDRLARMEDILYDDKLAGVINRERYEQKRAGFDEQRKELLAEQEQLSTNVAAGLEQRIHVLELTQKAAELYMKFTPEQKRLLLVKLFSSITSRKDRISVKYTNFTQAIADRSAQTKELIGGLK